MARQLLAYCTPQSVVPGEAVRLHASAGSPGPVRVTVTRVGAERVVASRVEGVRVERRSTPVDAVATGCGWPTTVELATEQSWPSGYYEVALEGVDDRDVVARTTAYFVVRPAPGTTKRILLPLSTNTWNAYNDFGGANTYTGATQASFERPMAPGLLEKPPGAGRRVAVTNPPDPSQTTHVGYLILNGLSEWAGSAGWPNYEEPFIAWAERAGYEFDVATSADLDLRPEVVEGCTLLLSVGHDEYWSAPQRDTVERHLDGGGNVAFLSGNTCYWQVRIEDGGATMIAYKQRFEDDPVHGTDAAATTTTLWAHPVTGRPEAALTGVSFTRGGTRGSVPGFHAAPAATPSTVPGTGSSPGPVSSTATCSARTRPSSATSATGATSRWSTASRCRPGWVARPCRSRSSPPRPPRRSIGHRACDRYARATGRSSSSTRSACSATTRPPPRHSSQPATPCSAPTGTRAVAPW